MATHTTNQTQVIMSRYNEPRYLVKVKDNIYHIVCNHKFIRVGGDLQNPEFIDFDGGPFIEIGTILNFKGTKIKVICIKQHNANTYELITE